MKLLLFKLLLQRRAQNKGFVIPVVIAFGLIMALLGTFSIVQSSEENLGAITDNSNAKALAAAEAGVARYLDLISNNRKIAMYASGNWTTPTELCNTDTEITNAITGFQDVVSSTGTYDNLGQYQLVSYAYLDNTDTVVADGTTPDNTTKGRLTVEGRSSANDSGARTIQVDIPVRREEPDLSDLDPALWINSPTVTNIGGDNLEVGNDINNDGDFVDTISGVDEFSNSIVFSDLADNVSSPAVAGCTPTTGGNQPSAVNTETIVSVPYNVPNTPPDPTNRIFIDYDDLEDLIVAGGQLPFPFGFDIDDAQDANDYYHYVVNVPVGEVLTFDGDLPVTSGRKVILYVCGDIEFTNTTATPININQNPVTNGSSNLEIYGNNATTTYTIDSSGTPCANTTPTITFSNTGTGAINVKAFIHSPGATVTTSGSPTVNWTGAMWVDNWNDGTAGSQITITPDSYEAYSSRQSMDAIPTIGAVTDWKIVETN